MKRATIAVLGCVLALLVSAGVRADQIDNLLKDLAAGDSGKQLAAIASLKQIKDPRITTAVIARASDVTTALSVRKVCIDVIAGQNLLEGLGALLEIAGNPRDAFAVRSPALMGVVRLSGSEHVGLFIKLIREDKESLIRSSAAMALGSTGDPKITPQILGLLNDPDFAIASYAVVALGLTKDPAVVPRLIEKLNTDSPILRGVIIEALGRLGDKRAITPLLALLPENNEYQRILVISALGNIDDPRVVKTLGALALDKTATENMRTRALLSIAALNAVAALPSVSAIATNPGEKITLRLDATRTLGSLGDDAIPVLLSLLDEKGLAESASLSLGKITKVYLGTDHARWTQFYNDYKARKSAPN